MRWILFFSLFFFYTAGAQQTGTVIKIIDGDTFDLLTRDNKTIRIRMDGIDCPERKQDYYQAARDALAKFIFKKEVTLQTKGRDRNRRVIAVVYRVKENINLKMIKGGYAWHYKKYSADTLLAKAESEARRHKRGLWKMDRPLPPWEFRKNRTMKRSAALSIFFVLPENQEHKRQNEPLQASKGVKHDSRLHNIVFAFISTFFIFPHFHITKGS